MRQPELAYANAMLSKMSRKGLTHVVEGMRAEYYSLLRHGNPVAQAVELLTQEPDSTKMNDLDKALEAHAQTNSIIRTQKALKHPPTSGSSVPNYRQRILEQVAEASNGRLSDGSVMLTAAQLTLIANLHPTLGYYTQEYGIARFGEDNECASAFVTPLELDPNYREAYAEAAYKAYGSLRINRPFTKDDPFRVFIFGDGEGRLTKAVAERMSTPQVDKEGVEMVVVDASPALLNKQQAGFQDANTGVWAKFQTGNALEIGRVLALYPNSRGVILAGEELFDDVPAYILGLSGSSLKEYAFIFSGNAELSKVLAPISRASAPLLQTWLSAFPHYKDLLMRRKKDPAAVPFGFGLLDAMKDISSSSFEGYWMGGDYSCLFTAESFGNQGARAYSPLTKHSLPLEDAVQTVANITMDVDPGLFVFGKYLNLRPDFLGRMGHFTTLMTEGKIKASEEITEFFDSQQVYTALNDAHVLAKLHNLHSYYGQPRFNWVMAKGNVPPLVTEADRFPW